MNDGSAERPAPPTFRQHFSDELDQLRLQVEVMGVRVDQNLELMLAVVRTGDRSVAEEMLRADDDIDAMNVSLTERCYEVLRREAPVATDLRLVVSVLRILSELERVGDLALRVAKRAPDHELLVACPSIFTTLVAMAEVAVSRFRSALVAWASLELDHDPDPEDTQRGMDRFHEELMGEVLTLTGSDSVPTAVAAFAVGRSVERIADHAAIIGARIRYLVTGDPAHLAAEVR